MYDLHHTRVIVLLFILWRAEQELSLQLFFPLWTCQWRGRENYLYSRLQDMYTSSSESSYAGILQHWSVYVSWNFVLVLFCQNLSRIQYNPFTKTFCVLYLKAIIILWHPWCCKWWHRDYVFHNMNYYTVSSHTPGSVGR